MKVSVASSTHWNTHNERAGTSELEFGAPDMGGRKARAAENPVGPRTRLLLLLIRLGGGAELLSPLSRSSSKGGGSIPISGGGSILTVSPAAPLPSPPLPLPLHLVSVSSEENNALLKLCELLPKRRVPDDCRLRERFASS